MPHKLFTTFATAGSLSFKDAHLGQNFISIAPTPYKVSASYFWREKKIRFALSQENTWTALSLALVVHGMP